MTESIDPNQLADEYQRGYRDGRRTSDIALRTEAERLAAEVERLTAQLAELARQLTAEELDNAANQEALEGERVARETAERERDGLEQERDRIAGIAAVRTRELERQLVAVHVERDAVRALAEKWADRTPYLTIEFADAAQELRDILDAAATPPGPRVWALPDGGTTRTVYAVRWSAHEKQQGDGTVIYDGLVRARYVYELYAPGGIYHAPHEPVELVSRDITEWSDGSSHTGAWRPLTDATPPAEAGEPAPLAEAPDA